MRISDWSSDVCSSDLATEHLLISLATVESSARTVLTDAGLTETGLREGLTAVRGNRRVTSQEAESTYESLEKYSVDLTKAAEERSEERLGGEECSVRVDTGWRRIIKQKNTSIK